MDMQEKVNINIKEHVVTFQVSLDQNRIKDFTHGHMKKILAGFGVRKIDEDYDTRAVDGYADFSFVFVGRTEELKKKCEEILDVARDKDIKIAVDIQFKEPAYLINPKDVKDLSAFTTFYESLLDKFGGKEKIDEKDSQFVRVSFVTSENAEKFKREYIARAREYMKDATKDVEVFNDWQHKEVLAQNNHESRRKIDF